MYLIALKIAGKWLLERLTSPWTWVLILAATTVLCAYGWRSQSATTAQVTADCEAKAEAVLRTNLELAAQAWMAVYEAQREAVVRQATAEAKAAAEARAWREKYREALRVSPECAKWSQVEIACPIS